jgi:hypothetical protein
MVGQRRVNAARNRSTVATLRASPSAPAGFVSAVIDRRA